MKSKLKSVSLMMATIMIICSLPEPPAHSAVIDTTAILDAPQIQQTRKHLKQILTRKVVQNRLADWGISPLEAAACVDSLTDDELKRFSAQIEDLAAGGNGGPWGFVGIALVVTFVILLITDLLGYTDFFNIR